MPVGLILVCFSDRTSQMNYHLIIIRIRWILLIKIRINQQILESDTLGSILRN